MYRLFVYGTLRRGGGKEALLGDSRLIGHARVRGRLYDLSEYPALVVPGETEVLGDLRDCSAETVRRLDSYEGVEEGLFERRLVTTDAGRAWAYVAGPALAERLARSSILETGRWPPA